MKLEFVVHGQNGSAMVRVHGRGPCGRRFEDIAAVFPEHGKPMAQWSFEIHGRFGLPFLLMVGRVIESGLLARLLSGEFEMVTISREPAPEDLAAMITEIETL